MDRTESRDLSQPLGGGRIPEESVCLSASAVPWFYRTLRVFLASLAISMVWAGNAYAYIDPGSGALIWQLLLAAFFGSLFFIRRVKIQIRAMVVRIWALITGKEDSGSQR